MKRAIVGVFDRQAEAQQARSALLSDGFNTQNVRVTSSEGPATNPSGSQSDDHDESFGEKLAGMLGFGRDADRLTYSEAMRRGSLILVADVSTDAEAERAEDIMEQFNPVDIDERESQWRESGWQGAGGEPAEEAHIPIVEDDFDVGKREIRRGGIHVRSHNYEEPVED